MIVRSAAVRQGRRAFFQLSRRGFSSETTTTTTTAKTATAVAEPPQNDLKDAPSASTATPDALPSIAKNAAWGRRRPAAAAAAAAAAGHAVVQDYTAQTKLARKTRQLGAQVQPRYHPDDVLTNPPAPKDVTLELLMASQAHLGHHTSLWHPGNAPYILGIRNGIHVIALEQTATALRRAARVMEETAARGGLVLFVGTRQGHMDIVVRAARLAGPGACHLFTKWVPGTITNRDVLLAGARTELVDECDRPLADALPDRTGQRLQYRPRPLRPDLVVVLNPVENRVLLHECGLSHIPTIGLIDTDADPARVTYPIPGNDDSLRTVAVVAGVLGRAAAMGQRRRLRDAAQGVVPWQTSLDLQRAWDEGRRTEVGSRVAPDQLAIRPWLLAGGKIF